MTSQGQAAVWTYFTKSEDAKMIECNIYKKSLTFCGGTTNMIRHLQGLHTFLNFDHTENKTPEKKKPVKTQRSMKEYGVSTRNFCSKKRASGITERITNYIAKDMRPINTVEVSRYIYVILIIHGVPIITFH